MTAVVVPSDLPLHPIPFNLKWKHLSGLQLADPVFGQPRKIDILSGSKFLLKCCSTGGGLDHLNLPSCSETKFGWVLAGRTDAGAIDGHITTFHTSLVSGDDLLRKFWEIEEWSLPFR